MAPEANALSPELRGLKVRVQLKCPDSMSGKATDRCECAACYAGDSRVGPGGFTRGSGHK